jgi:hypothetical protein
MIRIQDSDLGSRQYSINPDIDPFENDSSITRTPAMVVNGRLPHDAIEPVNILAIDSLSL